MSPTWSIRTCSRWLLLALLIGATVPAVGRAAPTDSLKYWVFFTEKDAIASKRASIAPKAVERRRLRARSVLPETDIPVSDSYVGRVAELGGRVVHTSRWLNAASVWLAADDAAVVAGLPFVRGIRPVAGTRPDAVRAPAVSPRLVYGDSKAQLETVNAIPLLESGLSGAGVRVGIVDTGAGDIGSIPSLRHFVDDGRMIEQRDFSGQPADNYFHGRWVLSVLGGFDDGDLIGPAHGAELLLARTEYTPTETNEEEDALVAAMEWMESEGVDVVNISLGYSAFDAGENSYEYDDMDGETAVTTLAAERAVDLGVVVVSSAGNEGGRSWRYITSPADGPSVITVGGVSYGGLLAPYSGRGPTADGRTKPDVVAQSSYVRYARSESSYSFGNGTSFSAPMVSGIVALMLERYPALTPDRIREVLRSTADRASAPDNDYGWGVVDAVAALQKAAEPVDTPSAAPLLLYPNPAADVIRLGGLRGRSGTIEIMDVLGRRVRYAVADGSVDITDLSPGTYLYRVITDSRTDSGTFIKAR